MTIRTLSTDKRIGDLHRWHFEFLILENEFLILKNRSEFLILKNDFLILRIRFFNIKKSTDFLILEMIF